MLKVIGVLAIVGALAIGYFAFRGSVNVNVSITKQGQQELHDARNSLADHIRAGSEAVVENVKE